MKRFHRLSDHLPEAALGLVVVDERRQKEVTSFEGFGHRKVERTHERSQLVDNLARRLDVEIDARVFDEFVEALRLDVALREATTRR